MEMALAIFYRIITASATKREREWETKWRDGVCVNKNLENLYPLHCDHVWLYLGIQSWGLKVSPQKN